MSRLNILLIGSILFIGTASTVQGQTYAIDWYTVDGGGGTSSGGNFTLSGTIGQPDAGSMAGGDYVLDGGFWTGGISCIVNLPDLAGFLSEWLLRESEVGHPLDADFDNNGEVNLKDYNYLCSYWMQNCPANWPSW